MLRVKNNRIWWIEIGVSVRTEEVPSAVSPIAEDLQREDRHIGSTLFNLGKLTLTSLIKNSNKFNLTISDVEAGKPSKIITSVALSSESSESNEANESSASNSVEVTTEAPVVTPAPEVRRCKTPKGGEGKCRDLTACPALLLQLENLRKSICFQSLFVPGVCCPDDDASGAGPIASLINHLVTASENSKTTTTTERSTTRRTTTRPTTHRTTTVRDVVTLTTTERPFQAPIVNHSPNQGNVFAGIVAVSSLCLGG